MAKTLCERSEPISAAGAVPRAWGADSPPSLPVNEHPVGCLFNRENLALRKNNRPSPCVSPAAAVTAVRVEWKVGYKVDISKAKSGYKVDTIISNL